MLLRFKKELQQQLLPLPFRAVLPHPKLLPKQQFSNIITKAIVSPVVSDNLLSLSNTAYNSKRYSKLRVMFIVSPLIFQRLFLSYNMRKFSTLLQMYNFCCKKGTTCNNILGGRWFYATSNSSNFGRFR